MASKQEQAAQASNPAVDAAQVYESVSVEELGEFFRSAGYRVTPAEQNGQVQLMSASQGVGFAVRLGNRTPDEGRFLDYTLACVLQVQGDIPQELVSSWARTKRFARLSAHGQFLVLEMDVVTNGGVTGRYVTSMIGLWDRMMQEFLLHLRNRSATAAASRPADVAAGSGDAAVSGAPDGTPLQ